jgi:hypothetical protein
MTTPYAFGRHLGSLSKEAAEKEARGILADMALYSNPWTGVPTGVYDTYNSLRSGNYLGALGNVAATGLSFMGAGGVGSGMKALGAKALGRGTAMATRGGLRAVAGTGLKAVGHAANAAGSAAVAGANIVNKAQAPFAKAIQKVVPVRQGATFMRSPVRAMTNVLVQNPLMFPAMAHTGGNPNPPVPAVKALNAAKSYMQPRAN